MAKTTVPSQYIADNAVTTAKIAANAITAEQIAGGAIVSVDLGDNSITIASIASNAVGSSEIAANAVENSEIAANAVDSAEIVSGSIDTAHLSADAVDGTKIADDSIDSEHYVDGSIDTAHIGDSQVTNAKLANSSVTVNSNSVALGASITLDTDDIGEGSTNLYYTDARAQSAISAGTGITVSSGEISIAGNALTATMISANAVGSSEIAANSVDSAEIAANAVSTSELASTAAPTFASITTTGDGDIGGNLTVTGNLQVDGTTTTINSTNLSVDDLNITVAAGAANAAAADGAGLTVDGANATITYDGTDDEWDFNKTLNITGGMKVYSNARIGTSQLGTNSVLDVFGGAMQIINAASFEGSTADATLHIKGAEPTQDRLTQISAQGTSQRALNLIGSTNANATNQWWSWGVDTDDEFKILHGTSFSDALSGIRIQNNGNLVTGTISSGAITSTGAITAKSGGGFYLQPTDAHDTDAWILYQYNDNTLRYNFTGSGADEIIIKYPNATNATTLLIDTEEQRVGIGTDSPTCALDVVGATATPLVLELSTGNSNCDVTMQSGNTSSVTRLRNNTNDFQIHTNGAERMRIDSSGNVGIGASPSSTIRNDITSAEKALQIGNRAMFFSDGGVTTDLQNNSHLNNSDQRVAMQTDLGSLYQQYQGVHKWFNAASVSAGAEQTMIERMRIDSAGNVDVNSGRIKVVNSGTDAYFYEGVRDGGNVTLRMYDNNNNLYIDSYTSMALRCNQTGGGSGGQIFLTGGDVNIGSSSDSARYLIFDKTISGESGILFRNASNNKGKILLNANEELKFYVNNTTDAMTINETSSSGGSTTIPGVQIGNLSHGWGNLVVTSDDSSWDGGITIAAASTSGGSAGYGALFWKQGGIAAANTKWFMGLTNSTSDGAAYDDILIGAYNLNTGYSRGGRTDGVMHFDRSNGDVHVAKQVNFHGQQGFKVYNASGFSKSANWQNISGSITTVDYNNGGWSSSTGRFQPTKAGYYLFTFGGWAGVNSDGSRYATSFSKNTTSQRYLSGGDYCAVDSPMNGHSEIIYMNGSTDYVDLYAYSSVATTWGGSSHAVWWGAEFLH